MRHSAGERADAFQPLCPQELFLGLFLLGDVGVDDQNGLWLSQLIPHEGPATSDYDSAAVLAVVLALTGPRSILNNGCSCRSDSGRSVLVKKAEPCLALNFRGSPAIQFFRAVIPKFDVILHIADHDCVLRKI